MAKKRTKTEKEQYVMICPKCKSSDVYMDKSNPLQPVIGLPANYICNNCKFKGFNFPEIEKSKLKKFQKKTNEKKQVDSKKEKALPVDTAYGNFIVRAVWKISAPVILLLGIFLLFIIPFLGIVITATGLIMIYFTYIKK
ncbi:hypothetical protein KY336_01345 [Candidatus Woesearchaeota archaeon]|nr:hypothetical protein [Candidatus Woesearchaeota archaeon]